MPHAFWTFDLAMSESLGLHLQVHLGVDVRCGQRDVGKPGANRVDVDTGSQQMSSRRVSNGMGAHALCRQGGNLLGDLHGIAFDHLIDTKAGDGLLTTIEKHSLSWSSVVD